MKKVFIGKHNLICIGSKLMLVSVQFFNELKRRHLNNMEKPSSAQFDNGNVTVKYWTGTGRATKCKSMERNDSSSNSGTVHDDAR